MVRIYMELCEYQEFEKEKDMKKAFYEAEGRRIEGRRILVDVTRARTVKSWKPRRLGGGIGSTRATRKPKEKESSRYARI